MAKKTATKLEPTGEPPEMDEADGVRVGEEPFPGSCHRRSLSRHSQATASATAEITTASPPRRR